MPPPSKCFRFFTGLCLTPHCSTAQNKSVSANMAMATSLPITAGTKWTAEKTPPRRMSCLLAVCCAAYKDDGGSLSFSMVSGLMGQSAWLNHRWSHQTEGCLGPLHTVVFGFRVHHSVCTGVDLEKAERKGCGCSPSSVGMYLPRWHA